MVIASGDLKSADEFFVVVRCDRIEVGNGIAADAVEAGGDIWLKIVEEGVAVDDVALGGHDRQSEAHVIEEFGGVIG